MAVIRGVNGGFVTEAPTADPDASSGLADNNSIATVVTSPVGAVKVIEIGWWCSTASDAANFEVGVYSDDGGEPDALLGGVSRTNAKGTTSGWKRVTGLNISISAETNYWLAFQLDAVPGNTFVDWGPNGSGQARRLSGSTLPSSWSGGITETKLVAIYAIAEIEAPAGFTRKIKISGTFADKPIKTKVAGTFQDKPIKIKVGGTFQDA